ncbi:MAG: hypothetical protein K9M99_02875 [Candidatus Cloacimonetes bacterium]|nr:hypothetical protein [Candidatus Cloacimonadota bacterium]
MITKTITKRKERVREINCLTEGDEIKVFCYLKSITGKWLYTHTERIFFNDHEGAVIFFNSIKRCPRYASFKALGLGAN